MSCNGNGTKQRHVGGRGMMSPNGMMGGHDVPQWERDKATTRGGEGHDVPQWDDGGGMMSPNGDGTKQPHVGGRGMMSPNGMMGGA